MKKINFFHPKTAIKRLRGGRLHTGLETGDKQACYLIVIAVTTKTPTIAVSKNMLRSINSVMC
jgi:hypothetical protein